MSVSRVPVHHMMTANTLLRKGLNVWRLIFLTGLNAKFWNYMQNFKGGVYVIPIEWRLKVSSKDKSFFLNLFMKAVVVTMLEYIH